MPIQCCRAVCRTASSAVVYTAPLQIDATGRLIKHVRRDWQARKLILAVLPLSGLSERLSNLARFLSQAGVYQIWRAARGLRYTPLVRFLPGSGVYRNVLCFCIFQVYTNPWCFSVVVRWIICLGLWVCPPGASGVWGGFGARCVLVLNGRAGPAGASCTAGLTCASKRQKQSR